jgi:hypothetical protein
MTPEISQLPEFTFVKRRDEKSKVDRYEFTAGSVTVSLAVTEHQRERTRVDMDKAIFSNLRASLAMGEKEDE